MNRRKVGIAVLCALSLFDKGAHVQNVANKVFKMTLFILAFAFGWCTQLGASGAVGSTSPTEIRVSFQHPGYTASAAYDGKKYEICLYDENGAPKGCEKTDNQYTRFRGLVVGKTYGVKAYCKCKGSAKFAVFHKVKLLDVNYTHQAPAPPTQPQIVQLRAAQSNMCLYTFPNDPSVRSWACVPWVFMDFAIEDAPGGGTQIRNLLTGLCIHGSTPNTPDLRMAPCGTFGTLVWIMPTGSGHVRLNILATEGSPPGSPPIRGPGGCVRPQLLQGEAAYKAECTWGGDLSDVFYLDPR